MNDSGQDANLTIASTAVERTAQSLHTRATSGSMLLQLAGDTETFTVDALASDSDWIAALTGLTAIAPGDVKVTGIGSEGAPWIIQFATNGSRSGEDFPEIQVIENNLLDIERNAAAVTVETIDAEHIDLTLDGSAVIFGIGKSFDFSGNPDFRLSLDEIIDILRSHDASASDDGQPDLPPTRCLYPLLNERK